MRDTKRDVSPGATSQAVLNWIDTMDEESIQLLGRFREGDEEAATEIYHRYVRRLIGLAQTRISAKLNQKLDADDVVQSVYRSFYRRAKEGRFALQRAGDLWRLLAAITVNKVRKKARFHGQLKRDMGRQGELNEAVLVQQHAELFAEGPATPDAVAVFDELSVVLRDMDERQRTMVEMRLQGHELQEISEEVGRSTRTVRRTLNDVRDVLEKRFFEISCE